MTTSSHILTDRVADESIWREPTADQLRKWFIISPLIGVVAGVIVSIGICNYEDRILKGPRPTRTTRCVRQCRPTRNNFKRIAA